MKKIGLLGGSFDPIHQGHIQLALHAEKLMQLDHIIFIPNYQSPFKTSQTITSPIHRLNMLELALKAYPNFSISDIEIQNPQIHYTYNTVTQIQKAYPNTKLYFIAGSDILKNLKQWNNFIKLIKKIQFIIAPREPLEYKDINQQTIVKDYPQSFKLLDCSLSNISSTDIRLLQNKPETLQQNSLIPLKVAEYIKLNNLYV